MSVAVLPALAISASNCTQDAAFSLALRSADGAVHVGASSARGDLAVLAQQLCAAAGVAAADLRELRVDRGPGSYTGLRIAVTFARTLHAFGEARLLCATSFELLAAAAQLGGERTSTQVVLDGRRDRLLVATVGWHGEHLACDAPPAAVSCADWRQRLQPDQRVLAPAALLPRLQPFVESAGAALRAATPAGAGLLFDARLAPSPCALAELEPLYLLASYAE